MNSWPSAPRIAASASPASKYVTKLRTTQHDAQSPTARPRQPITTHNRQPFHLRAAAHRKQSTERKGHEWTRPEAAAARRVLAFHDHCCVLQLAELVQAVGARPSVPVLVRALHRALLYPRSLAILGLTCPKKLKRSSVRVLNDRFPM